MFCTNCGNELRDDAKFCTACGQAVKGAPAPDAEAPAEETAPLPVAGDADATEEQETGHQAETAPESESAPEQGLDAEETVPLPAAKGVEAAEEPASSVEPPADATLVSPVPFDSAVSADADADAPSEPSAPAAPAASPKPKKKAPIIVAAAAVVAFIMIAAVAFFVLHGTGTSGILFGQDTEVELCVTTVVKPYNKNGEAMRSYDAYLVQRDAEGDAASVDTTPYHVSVTDYADLKLSDFADLPDGGYTLVIVDHSSGSDTRQEISVNYGKDNAEAGSEVSISTPATDNADSSDETTDQQKAYALYLAKIREYTDLYGTCGSADLNGWPVATGLCVADLVDFNTDGLDELLLVYNTGMVDGSADDWMTKQIAAIKTEVWAYSDGEISKVYDLDDTLDTTNGGMAWLSVYKCGDTLELHTFKYMGDSFDDEGNYTDECEIVFRAFDGSSFTETQSLYEKFFSPKEGDTTDTCIVDGKDVTQDELSAAWDTHKNFVTYSLVEWANQTGLGVDTGSGYRISQLPDLIVSTTQKLKDGLSASSSTAKDGEDDTKSEAAYASTEIEATVSVPDAQVLSMDPEADDAYDVTWTYVQFAYKDGTSDSALDALNAKLKNEFEADVDATTNWDRDDDGELVTRDDTVTSIEGNYACVFHGRYQTNGGPHGWDVSEVVYYDLSTGEEVSVSKALGTDEITLQSYAVDGVNAFLEQNPSDIGTEGFSTLVTDMTRYGRDSKGIFFCTRSYELGSYAFGSHRIYIMATNGDDSIVGTECAISSIS